MDNNTIDNGAFLVARKLFDSDVWLMKPSSWVKIWIYIIGHVNHKENGHFGRGEGYFNFTSELRNLGDDITPDIVKKFLQYGRRTQLLSTKRSTRGIIIKVLNYNKYQTLSNYVSTMPSTREAREKHERSTPINKNVRMKELNKQSLSSDDDTYTLQDYIKSMRASPRRYIRLLGEYADEKKPDFTTKGQWRVFTSRNLRIAKQLEPFTDTQIGRAYEVMTSDWSRMKKEGKAYSWGLETIIKYLNK